jgi:hypothetical protein
VADALQTCVDPLAAANSRILELEERERQAFIAGYTTALGPNGAFDLVVIQADAERRWAQYHAGE